MTSDYTLFYLSQYKQRDMLQERENDRLAQKAAQETKETATKKQALQEQITSYRQPQKAASKP
ncbi:MAG: hypothetical protein K8I82_10140 [Anaerolineae bacterium]|nr:hypothetical protein [Anaerolineae bacterium]